MKAVTPSDDTPTSIILVQNWLAELERLVPTEN